MSNELEVGEKVMDLFFELYRKPNEHLQKLAHDSHHKKDCFFACPDLLVSYLKVALHEKVGLQYTPESTAQDQFFGIQVIPNYELSIVLYHKDCIINPELKEKILLQDPYRENHERYQKIVFDLNDNVNLSMLFT